MNSPSNFLLISPLRLSPHSVRSKLATLKSWCSISLRRATRRWTCKSNEIFFSLMASSESASWHVLSLLSPPHPRWLNKLGLASIQYEQAERSPAAGERPWQPEFSVSSCRSWVEIRIASRPHNILSRFLWTLDASLLPWPLTIRVCVWRRVL